MALPTVSDVKGYLRIEHADEDNELARQLSRAKAAVETHIGYPLTAAAYTHVDYTETDNYGVQPTLRLPGPFKTSSPAPVVTDYYGTTVASTTYALDPRFCVIRALPGYAFCNRPYTIAATIGLSAHPDYASRLEPIASLAIIELVAHWYQNRNPAAASETDEAGGTVSQVADADAGRGMPPRILADLALLPHPRGMNIA